MCVHSTSLFPGRCNDTLSTKLGRRFKSKHGYVAQSPGAISQVSKPSFEILSRRRMGLEKGRRRFQLGKARQRKLIEPLKISYEEEGRCCG